MWNYATSNSAPPRRRPVTPQRWDLVRYWQTWGLPEADEPALLTHAELSECRCPDLCDRDHQND